LLNFPVSPLTGFQDAKMNYVKEEQSISLKTSSSFPFHPFASSSFPPPLDGLIVLGARLNPQGEPGRVARLRLVYALNLWRHSDCRVYVLISGGCSRGSTCSEARAMAEWARRWVRQHWGEEASQSLNNCLILEEASLTTAASARHALPVVAARGSRTVGLVTDAVHIHRARFLFQRQFRHQGIRVHSLPARGLVRHYWRQRRILCLGKLVLREGGAWLKVLGKLALRRP
jgi:hypothetical protein